MKVIVRAGLILSCFFAVSGSAFADDTQAKQEEPKVSVDYAEVKDETTVISPMVKLPNSWTIADTKELSLDARYTFEGKVAQRPPALTLQLSTMGTGVSLQGVEVVYFRFGEGKLKLPVVHEVNIVMTGIAFEALTGTVPTDAFVQMLDQVAATDKVQYEYGNGKLGGLFKGEIDSAQMLLLRKIVETFPASVAKPKSDNIAQVTAAISTLPLEQLRALSVLIQKRIKELEAERKLPKATTTK